MGKLIKKSFTFEGKRYYVYGKTEVDAEVNKALKLKELEEGSYTIKSSILFSEWIEKCLETYKMPTMTDKRYKSYKYIAINCISDQIGHLKLNQIRQLHCQECINAHAGKSKYTIAQTKQAMNFFFKMAVQNNLIARNPAENITLPIGTVTKRRALTNKERESFLRMSNDPHFKVFQLMYYCGCRPSEACNVQGLDIIKKDGYNLLHIRGTKSEAADRYVPIPDELYQSIKNTKKFDFIATNLAGNHHTDKSYRRAWKALRRAMNIDMGCRVYRNQLMPPFPLAEDLVPYCLRHTYCTDLRDKGIDIRTAQYLMGHSDITMTANIYTHSGQDTAVNAAAQLSSVVNGVVQPLITVEK